MKSPILVRIEHHIARITLCREEQHNAFDAAVIAELTAAIKTLAANPSVRALTLDARGKSFCAGADLAWMKEMAKYSEAENLADAAALAELFRCLSDFPAPTLCVVQGAAYGGAIGLIACCDLVIASNRAAFCLSEVKLGLSPATISPFVMRAMGYRNTLRYALTAERFDAIAAREAGLVHWVSKPDELEEQQRTVEAMLLANGPNAQRETKALFQRVAETPIADIIQPSCELIAQLRVSPEGQEGLSAFFESRTPNWRQPQ